MELDSHYNDFSDVSVEKDERHASEGVNSKSMSTL